MPPEEIKKQTYCFMSRYIDSLGNEISSRYDEATREDVFKHLLFVVGDIKTRSELTHLYKQDIDIYDIVDYTKEKLRKSKSHIRVNISMRNPINEENGKIYVTINGEQYEMDTMSISVQSHGLNSIEYQIPAMTNSRRAVLDDESTLWRNE